MLVQRYRCAYICAIKLPSTTVGWIFNLFFFCFFVVFTSNFISFSSYSIQLEFDSLVSSSLVRFLVIGAVMLTVFCSVCVLATLSILCWLCFWLECFYGFQTLSLLVRWKFEPPLLSCALKLTAVFYTKTLVYKLQIENNASKKLCNWLR